jgi:hypothetical protein
MAAATCKECGRAADMPRRDICRACYNAQRRAVDADTAQGRVENVRYQRFVSVYERKHVYALIERSAWQGRAG